MVFNIINKIKNLFYRSKTFNIIFSIENNNIKTTINYNEKCFDDATKIASIIYALNNGALLNKIIDSLVSIGLNTKLKDKEFIIQIINKLNYYYNIDTQDSIVVLPLETFHKNAK